MKISDVIKHLQDIKAVYGDIPVGGTIVGDHSPRFYRLNELDFSVDADKNHLSIVTIEDFEE